MIPLWTSIGKSILDPPWSVIFKDFQKGPTQHTRVAQREPKRTQGRPGRTKCPIASQKIPNDPLGTPKGLQRRPIYIKTPDQPHQRPLYYELGLG